MEIQVVTSIISAASIILGSLLGALSSYIISNKMYKKQLTHEKEKEDSEKIYDKTIRNKCICDNANAIRLDIANAIFQSIRSLKSINLNKDIYLLPVSRNYSALISSLNHLFSLKELSEIYQLYVIIEKVSNDIYYLKTSNNEDYEVIKKGFISILYKIYGENYDKILLVDPNAVSYFELEKSTYMKNTFKNILFKLDSYCILENLI
ncbi:hypothetical protein ACTNDG_08955 [Clostridium sp. HCP1S3_B4]|uniref:hypothetical protein n=1 Tax=unclassified Clostridium TaxID=2614128 RepID=UPI00169FBA1C|nr:hypothetical protein [Clostridiales bacterium]MDY2728894.1 hypothetical protein [Clostridium sp.]NLK24699.1 hypothetical protein [Clostridiales bacterium]